MKNTDALRDGLQYVCSRLTLGRPGSLLGWEAPNPEAPEGQPAGISQQARSFSRRSRFMRVMLVSRSMSGSGACKSRPTRFSGAFGTLPAYELNSLLEHHAADAILARHDAGPPHPGVEGR